MDTSSFKTEGKSFVRRVVKVVTWQPPKKWLRKRFRRFMEKTIVRKYSNTAKIFVCVAAACLALAIGLRELGVYLHGILPAAWLDSRGFVSSSVLGIGLVVECVLLLFVSLILFYTEGEAEAEGMGAWYPTLQERELDYLRNEVKELVISGRSTIEKLRNMEKKIEESGSLRSVVDGSPVVESGEMSPPAITDQVHFTLTAPRVLAPGCSYAIDVWAHHAEKLREVLERAKEELGQGNMRSKSKGAVRIARGTLISVNLRIPDLIIEDPEDTVFWDGEVGNATFSVTVPTEASLGSRSGLVTFLVNGMQVAKMHFVLEVGKEEKPLDYLAAREQRVRTAFASYASEDRDEVLSRIQGMLKVFPDLDVFVDVASLRSGDRWDQRLLSEIEKRDTFYLFWSTAASRSPWVEKEWRAALEKRGVEYIDPVPLVSPQAVPPPAELAAHLHFNDWMLAYMRGKL
jgi:hypothetical protein